VGGGGDSQSRGQAAELKLKPAMHTLNMCPDSKQPTLSILPPTPPLKNSTQPEHKEIARVEKLSNFQGLANKKRRDQGVTGLGS